MGALTSRATFPSHGLRFRNRLQGAAGSASCALLLVPQWDSDGARTPSDRECARAAVLPMHRMPRVRPSGASAGRPQRSPPRSCAGRLLPLSEGERRVAPLTPPSPGTSSGGSYVTRERPRRSKPKRPAFAGLSVSSGRQVQWPAPAGSERRVFRICFGSRRRPRRRVFRMAQRPVARAVRAKRRSRGVAASSPAAGSGSCSRSGSAGDSPGARPRPPRRGRPR